MSFPVQEAKNRKWIIENEGDVWSIAKSSLTNWNTVALPATTYGTNFFQCLTMVNPGQIGLLRSFTVSADGPCVFACHISKGGLVSGLNAFTDNFDQKAASRHQIIFGTNGGTETIIFGGEDGLDIYEGGGVYGSFFATSTVQPIVSISPNASMYTNDSNFSASKVFMTIGDSISWGSLGTEEGTSSRPNFGETHYSSRIANTLRAENNFDIRVSRRGFGGSTSNRWYEYIKSGVLDRTLLNYYNSNKTKLLITIGLGTNDAAISDAYATVTSPTSSTSTTTFRIRMEKIISYIYGKCPNASVIVLGPPNNDLTSGNRALNTSSYRVVGQQLVTEGIASGGLFVGKDLKYYDQSYGLSLNNIDYTEQSVGSHLHPRGDTGHLIIATGLLDVVKTTKFYLDNI